MNTVPRARPRLCDLSAEDDEHRNYGLHSSPLHGHGTIFIKRLQQYYPPHSPPGEAGDGAS